MKLVCEASIMLSLRERRGGVRRCEFVRLGWRCVRIGGRCIGASAAAWPGGRTSTGESGSSVRSITPSSCRGLSGGTRGGPFGCEAAPRREGLLPGCGRMSGGRTFVGRVTRAEVISTRSSSSSFTTAGDSLWSVASMVTCRIKSPSGLWSPSSAAVVVGCRCEGRRRGGDRGGMNGGGKERSSESAQTESLIKTLPGIRPCLGVGVGRGQASRWRCEDGPGLNSVHCTRYHEAIHSGKTTG